MSLCQYCCYLLIALHCSTALAFPGAEQTPLSCPAPARSPTPPSARPTALPRAAIIIDDLGYRMGPLHQLLALPQPLTLSIIPFTPYAQRIAQMAHAQGREVMVHAPMETLHERAWEPALNADMSHAELTRLSQAMLADIPYAQGLNNHGGSLLTQRREHMQWLMQALSERGFYFVDSRTTPNTIAGETAWQAGVPEQSRDVFLDNNRQPMAITKQLRKLESLARQHGYAVAIGHPYPETLTVLADELPKLEARGIRIVRVSELIEFTDPHTRLARKTVQSSQ